MRSHHVDVGGGLGIAVRREAVPEAEALTAACSSNRRAGTATAAIVEPRRALIGNAGVLVSEVLYLKAAEERALHRRRGMNDLSGGNVRAWMAIVECEGAAGGGAARRGRADLRVGEGSPRSHARGGPGRPRAVLPRAPTA